MNKNREAIDADIMTLVFYMKGGISYNDAWLLTTDQRKRMFGVIEKHYSALSGKDKNQL